MAGHRSLSAEITSAAWRGFFDTFPDYRNVFASLTAQDDVVTIMGHSECAEPSLAGPAIWTATIREQKVAEWRVDADTPDIRKTLRAEGGS